MHENTSLKRSYLVHVDHVLDPPSPLWTDMDNWETPSLPLPVHVVYECRLGLNKCFFFSFRSHWSKHYCFSEWHFFHIFVQWVHTTTTSTFANHPINYEPSVAVRQMHWQLNEMLCCCWSRWIFEVGLENGVSNCLKITNLEHCDMCVTFSVCNMV